MTVTPTDLCACGNPRSEHDAGIASCGMCPCEEFRTAPAPADEVHADLCRKGNYENIIGQPDMVHTTMPGAIPDLMWFVCPTEANGINMFPCTGSRHIDHRTVVVCTCPCHQVTSNISPANRGVLR